MKYEVLGCPSCSGPLCMRSGRVPYCMRCNQPPLPQDTPLRIFHHDDPPCEAMLYVAPNLGLFCLECEIYPDTQSLSLR